MPTWEFDAGETTAARIRVPAGSIHVNTTPARAIRVTVEPADEPGTARVKTVSGTISIDPAGGDVDGQTVSGDVLIGGVAGGRVAVKTTSGDITVAVVKGTAVQLDLSTLSGDASSELDHGGEA